MRRAVFFPVLALAFLAPIVWPSHAQQSPPPGMQQMPPPGNARNAPPPQVGTGVIFGQVVDGVSGDPLADVIVSPGRSGRAGGSGTPDSAANVFQPVMTGADGRFVFQKLPPGVYPVSASLPGYVPGSVGQGRPSGPTRSLELADGERIGDATIRLWKFAGITGTVLDESGDPAVELNVRAYRRLVVDGRPQIQPGVVQSARTDDRGRFRFARLTPGDYVVVVPLTQSTMPGSFYDALMNAMMTNPAAPPDWFMDVMMSGGETMFQNAPVRVGDVLVSSPMASMPTPSETGRSSGYRTTYYPSATLSTQASVVSVRAGEERTGIDMQLALVPTVRVSGTVRGPSGPMGNLAIRMLPAATDSLAAIAELDTAGAIVGADGTFTFLNVPSGQYTLRIVRAARSEMMTRMMAGEFGGPPPASAAPAADVTAFFAEQSLAVGETDVTGVSMVMRDAPKVSGRVEFELTPPKTAAQLTAGGGGIVFTPVDSALGLHGLGAMDPAKLDADGRFSTLGNAPDKYTIGLGPGRGSAIGVKSVTVGGRDVTNAPFEIKDADIGDVVIKFSDRTGTVSGVVRGSNGAPAKTATVVLFPADYRSLARSGLMPGRVQIVAASRAGSFLVGNLMPAEYLVVAVDDADVSDNQDSAFFDALARLATRITLGDAEKKTQDLIVAAVKR